MKQKKKVTKPPYPPVTQQDQCDAIEYLGEKLRELREKGYHGINVFQASNMSGQEVKHSSFIAWLLSPTGSHAFGDRMLRMFFEAIWDTLPEKTDEQGIILKKNQDILKTADAEGKTIDKASLLDLLRGEINVCTEQVIVNKKSRMDVLIDIPETKTVVVIENKVHSDTHDDQLERYRREIDHKRSKYRDYPRKFFVFLAPKGQPPINHGGDEKYNDSYCILSYEDILGAISMLKDDLTTGKTTLAGRDLLKLKILLEDYTEMVNNEILAKNPDIRAACKEIKKDNVCQWALSIYNEYEKSGDNIGEVLEFSIDWLKKNGPQETDENGNKVPGIKVFQTRKKSDYTGSINFSTPAMRKFYESYGEKITAQKTYKIGTEDGNVLQFFIVMERYKDKDWTPAQRLLVPAEKLQNRYCTTPEPFLTWEQRRLECNDDFKNNVLIPRLEYFLQLIFDNDAKLASLTKQP